MFQWPDGSAIGYTVQKTVCILGTNNHCNINQQEDERQGRTC